MGNAGQGGRNWAVALVHGIGHSEPTEMIQLVTRALSDVRKDLKLDEYTCVHESVPDNGGAAAGTGSAANQHVRHGTIGSAKVRFATAYWSDVALIGESLMNLIGSLALGGLGVRYFADVSTGSKTTPSVILHFLLSVMMILLAAVFLPLVTCSFLVSTMALIAFYVFRDGTLYLQLPFIAFASLTAATFIAYLGFSKFWSMRRERRLAIPIFAMLTIFSVVTFVVMIIDHPWGLRSLGLDPIFTTNGVIAAEIKHLLLWFGKESGNLHWTGRVGLLDDTSIYFAALQFFQYACGFAAILLTACSLVVLTISMLWPGITSQEKRSLLLGVVSVITMWALILLVLWPENLITASAINLYYNEKAKWLPELTAWRFDFLEWTFVKADTSSIASIKSLYPLLWFDIFFFVFLLGVFVVAVVLRLLRESWRLLHSSKSAAHLDRFRPLVDSGRKPAGCKPRLILTGFYQAAVLAFMFVISATVFAHWFGKDKYIVQNLFKIDTPDTLPKEVVLHTADVAFAVIVVIVIFLGVAHIVRQAVKLALDVVNHFAAPAQGFPVRHRIANRLKGTFDFLLKDNDRPNLVVICHSQGTVITLDTLFGYLDRDGQWQKGLWEADIKDRVASLTVLTFGSPITHIYQHYFSVLYPSFGELDQLKAVSQNPNVRWFNSYRVDDYIGTYIDTSIPRFPVNVPMAIGGHTSYWKADVFSRLFGEPGMETILVDTAPLAAQPAA